MLVGMLVSLLVTVALGWAPPSETRMPPEERITAPPPPGGAPSGGPPPAPVLQERPAPIVRARPADLGLERLPDGAYRYVDSERRFTMTVAPDGRAYFADRWRRPSSADAQNGKIGRRPGASSFAGKPGGFGMQGPLEWLLRASGHDLLTGAKMSALRETEAFRTDLAVAWSRGQIQKRLRELPADLLAVSKNASVSAQRRREILFEHWDACEDRLTTDTAGIPADAVVSIDRMRREAGEQARQTILDFIRRELSEPQEVFTAAELARFNTRRVSVARFDPYGAPDDQADAEPAAVTTAEPTEDPPTPDDDGAHRELEPAPED